MSFPTVLLFVATIGQFSACCATSIHDKWRGALWALIVPLAGWQLWYDGVLLSMVPLYLLLGFILLQRGVWRLHLWRGWRPKRRRWLTALGVALGMLLLAVPVVETAVFPFDPLDFRRQRWSTAFDRLHGTLETQYAFGEWKAIDWDALYAKHQPQIIAAEAAQDEMAYYLALRAYLFSLPDGHVGIQSPLQAKAELAAIGGGFGFAAVQLDDGRTIAHIVEPFGPAERAGLQWGAEIMSWNEVPIQTAVSAVSPLWSSRPPATAQNLSLVQHQLLTRAPVGTQLTFTFQNPNAARPQTVTITAVFDRFQTYQHALEWRQTAPATDTLQADILDDGLGYIRIAALEPTNRGLPPTAAMDEAMTQMRAANVQGLLLDVRGNRGGLDTIVPQMMRHFATADLYYEGITTYAPILGRDVRLLSLTVEAHERPFTKPVLLLVDHRTKSSGEGFALLAKALPNVTIIGLNGTDGSFGMAGASILMPTEIEIQFPWGQSVDQAGIVQVEGNQVLDGGVQPDIVVPLTLEAARAISFDRQDVLLEEAQTHLQQRLAEK